MRTVHVVLVATAVGAVAGAVAVIALVSDLPTYPTASDLVACKIP